MCQVCWTERRRCKRPDTFHGSRLLTCWSDRELFTNSSYKHHHKLLLYDCEFRLTRKLVMSKNEIDWCFICDINIALTPTPGTDRIWHKVNSKQCLIGFNSANDITTHVYVCLKKNNVGAGCDIVSFQSEFNRFKFSFPSPILVTLPRLKKPVCPTIYPYP